MSISDINSISSYDRLLSNRSAIFFLTLFLPRFVYATLLEIGKPYKAGVKIKRKSPGGYLIEREETFADFYAPRVLACFLIIVALIIIFLLFTFLPKVLIFLLSLSVFIDLILVGCRALYVHDKLKTADKSVPVRLEDLWKDQHEKEKEPSKADVWRKNKRETGEFTSSDGTVTSL